MSHICIVSVLSILNVMLYHTEYGFGNPEEFEVKLLKISNLPQVRMRDKVDFRTPSPPPGLSKLLCRKAICNRFCLFFFFRVEKISGVVCTMHA